MEISGSANGSTGWERISRKFVDYTASKPVEIGERWKNTYAYIGVTFSYILNTGIGIHTLEQDIEDIDWKAIK